MTTKIIYCLVSDTKDYYYEQLLVSLCSLRKYNPDAIVEVVVDKETKDTLVSERAGIYNYVTDVIQIDVPNEFAKKQRSRFIKTRLRELVSGDFFFIDTDTVIIGDLSIIDSIPADVAMAYDANSPFPVGNTNSFGDIYQ